MLSPSTLFSDVRLDADSSYLLAQSAKVPMLWFSFGKDNVSIYFEKKRYSLSLNKKGFVAKVRLLVTGVGYASSEVKNFNHEGVVVFENSAFMTGYIPPFPDSLDMLKPFLSATTEDNEPLSDAIETGLGVAINIKATLINFTTEPMSVDRLRQIYEAHSSTFSADMTNDALKAASAAFEDHLTATLPLVPTQQNTPAKCSKTSNSELAYKILQIARAICEPENRMPFLGQTVLLNFQSYKNPQYGFYSPSLSRESTINPGCITSHGRHGSNLRTAQNFVPNKNDAFHGGHRLIESLGAILHVKDTDIDLATKHSNGATLSGVHVYALLANQSDPEFVLDSTNAAVMRRAAIGGGVTLQEMLNDVDAGSVDASVASNMPGVPGIPSVPGVPPAASHNQQPVMGDISDIKPPIVIADNEVSALTANLAAANKILNDLGYTDANGKYVPGAEFVLATQGVYEKAFHTQANGSIYLRPSFAVVKFALGNPAPYAPTKPPVISRAIPQVQVVEDGAWVQPASLSDSDMYLLHVLELLPPVTSTIPSEDIPTSAPGAASNVVSFEQVSAPSSNSTSVVSPVAEDDDIPF